MLEYSSSYYYCYFLYIPSWPGGAYKEEHTHCIITELPSWWHWDFAIYKIYPILVGQMKKKTQKHLKVPRDSVREVVENLEKLKKRELKGK